MYLPPDKRKRYNNSYSTQASEKSAIISQEMAQPIHVLLPSISYCQASLHFLVCLFLKSKYLSVILKKRTSLLKKSLLSIGEGRGTCWINHSQREREREREKSE